MPRRARGGKKKKLRGGSLAALIKAYLTGVSGWAKSRITERQQQKAQLEQLRDLVEMKRLTGGKFDPKKDIVDFLAGPWGWLAMGMRKKREKEIAKLQQELAT